MSNVQKQKPSRTCIKSYSDYRSFRPYLKNDFNQRCGYCDDPDTHYGQEIAYHIDHFKPKSKFSSLKADYHNLVYSCPYCNNAKSNEWKDVDGFIDPCKDEYDTHLERDNKGKIIFKTPRGEYVVINLKLYLRRHSLIWTLGVLEKQKQQLKEIQTNNPNELDISKQFMFIQNKIDDYINNLGNI